MSVNHLNPKASIPLDRASYTKPKLTRFGAVGTLTQGGSDGMDEMTMGGGGMMGGMGMGGMAVMGRA